MCTNYEPIPLEEVTKIGMHQPKFDFDSEAYPGSLCPIIISGLQDDLEWRQAIFGLVPEWADGISFSKFTYNARMETVASKPSFRTAWRRNQFALIPMQSFYEPCYESGKSVRHRIERKDQEPFTVAAIWDHWSDHLNAYNSFSMLTINADNHPLMKHFHRPGDEKRSLVIIPPDLRQDWLNADHRTAQELIHEMTTAQFQSTAAPKPPKIKPTAKSLNRDLF